MLSVSDCITVPNIGSSLRRGKCPVSAGVWVIERELEDNSLVCLAAETLDYLDLGATRSRVDLFGIVCVILVVVDSLVLGSYCTFVIGTMFLRLVENYYCNFTGYLN